MEKFDAIYVLSSVLECGYSDAKYFVELVNKYDLYVDELKDTVKEIFCYEDSNLNAYIYAAHDQAYNNFREQLIEYIDNEDLNLDKDVIYDFEPNIYTNFTDSGYNSVLSEYDIMNFDEENIKTFLLEIAPDEMKCALDEKKEDYDECSMDVEDKASSKLDALMDEEFVTKDESKSSNKNKHK